MEARLNGLAGPGAMINRHAECITSRHSAGRASRSGVRGGARQDGHRSQPGERRFRDDGTKATRFYKPDDGNDQMNQKDEDVVHAGIKISKTPESRAILKFATDRRGGRATVI